VGKLVFWIVVIFGGLLAARLIGRQAAKQVQPRPPKRAAPLSGRQTAPESMVRCAHCGIHLPRSDAVLMDGKTWCSKEHAKLGVRK
jgi:uncharacterized protein